MAKKNRSVKRKLSVKKEVGSWDAFNDVNAFVEAVLEELKNMGEDGTISPQKGKNHSRPPLSGETLKRAIIMIWCVCFCGMQWRAAGFVSGIPFNTLYTLFHRWNKLGLWKRLSDRLGKTWRTLCDDTPEPTVLAVDSRSCRSSPTCGQQGIDGGKKVKGVKIHIAVDKHGSPQAISVSTANVHDTIGLLPILDDLEKQGFQGTLLGDAGYRGEKTAKAVADKGMLIIVQPNGNGKNFIPQGIRWVVERSFAWMSRYRRLNTIFERTVTHLIAFVQIAFISILARRINHTKTA